MPLTVDARVTGLKLQPTILRLLTLRQTTAGATTTAATVAFLVAPSPSPSCPRLNSAWSGVEEGVEGCTVRSWGLARATAGEPFFSAAPRAVSFFFGDVPKTPPPPLLHIAHSVKTCHRHSL